MILKFNDNNLFDINHKKKIYVILINNKYAILIKIFKTESTKIFRFLK